MGGWECRLSAALPSLACFPKTAALPGRTVSLHIRMMHQHLPPSFPPPLQADLFGDVAEAKEAAEFAGAYKEAKKCRAYETYQLLASIISFGDRIAELLTTVQVRGPGWLVGGH